MSADQLSAAFGVAKSTMSSKARQVRELLRISHFSPEFQRADVTAKNPFIWYIEVNGLAVDARRVPLDIQVEAFQRGTHPYIPTLGPGETAAGAGAQVTGTPSAASAAVPSLPGSVVTLFVTCFRRPLDQHTRQVRQQNISNGSLLSGAFAAVVR